ncbi:uncharacterized protein LOC124646533 [Lolium rigidum]|uniref:uncharacterized protein LOC124646533 n=1 Tax=Lolium rigidum TaxID=89674 RepID=UPI001F5D4D7D|nr:uncharacterized protein LOC124646533 [Lolium rigidum]
MATISGIFLNKCMKMKTLSVCSVWYRVSPPHGEVNTDWKFIETFSGSSLIICASSSVLPTNKRENFTEKIKRCTIYSKTYVQSMAVHYTLSWSPLLTAVRTSVVQCVRLESPPVRYAGSPMDQCPESNSCAHVWMLRNEAVLLCPVADDYSISTACDVHFFSEKRSLCNLRKLTVPNYAV